MFVRKKSYIIIKIVYVILSRSVWYDSDSPLGNSDLDSDLTVGYSDLDLPVGDSSTTLLS